MLGKIGGLMVGIVIDVNDPAGYNRIRVRIPALHGSITDEVYANDNSGRSEISNSAYINRSIDSSIPWAQVAFPFGSDVPPELNQVVVVGFINGDQNYPVVLGWLGYEYTNEERAIPKYNGNS